MELKIHATPLRQIRTGPDTGVGMGVAGGRSSGVGWNWGCGFMEEGILGRVMRAQDLGLCCLRSAIQLFLPIGRDLVYMFTFTVGQFPHLPNNNSHYVELL